MPKSFKDYNEKSNNDYFRINCEYHLGCYGANAPFWGKDKKTGSAKVGRVVSVNKDAKLYKVTIKEQCTFIAPQLEDIDNSSVLRDLVLYPIRDIKLDAVFYLIEQLLIKIKALIGLKPFSDDGKIEDYVYEADDGSAVKIECKVTHHHDKYGSNYDTIEFTDVTPKNTLTPLM